MKVNTNVETIDAIKDVISKQPDFPGTVRIFLAGMGWSGPSFGLSLDGVKDTDEKDDTNEVIFVMDKDLYDQVGEMKVEFVGNGYYVAPTNQTESGCSSCGGGCSN